MTIVTIHQAKTNLSKLVAMAEAGQEVVIARGSQPVARLEAISRARGKRRYGSLKGKMEIPDPKAFAPMTDEDLADWGLA